jgi:hypothetical protein
MGIPSLAGCMGDRGSRAVDHRHGRARKWHILLFALLGFALVSSFAAFAAEAKGRPEHVQSNGGDPPGKAVGRTTTPAVEKSAAAQADTSSGSSGKADRAPGRMKNTPAADPPRDEPEGANEPVPPLATPPKEASPPLGGAPDPSLREQRETFEFVHWIEGRTLLVLAFSLPADDHEEASYLWDWGDGNRFFDGPFSMHVYDSERGDLYLVTATRYNAHGATHQSARWIDLRMAPLSIDLPVTASEGAAMTQSSGARETRAEEPTVLTLPAPRVVYEAPVPPISTVILLTVVGIALRNIRTPGGTRGLSRPENSANGNP